MKSGKYSEFDYIIGVDCGTHTGLCIYSPSDKKIIRLETTKIHRAWRTVLAYDEEFHILVRVEDARLRKWFGNKAYEKMQGAGSIKRDCAIWEDFLKDSNIPYELVHPKDVRTKLGKAAFKKITGYEGSTSVHARDASMMVYGL